MGIGQTADAGTVQTITNYIDRQVTGRARFYTSHFHF